MLTAADIQGTDLREPSVLFWHHLWHHFHWLNALQNGSSWFDRTCTGNQQMTIDYMHILSYDLIMYRSEAIPPLPYKESRCPAAAVTTVHSGMTTQGVVTGINSYDWASWPQILRKWWSRFAFLLDPRKKRVCSQRSLADLQYSQTVKSYFAVQSSGQAVKVTVKISWPVLAVNTVCMGMTTPSTPCEIHTQCS